MCVHGINFSRGDRGADQQRPRERPGMLDILWGPRSTGIYDPNACVLFLSPLSPRPHPQCCCAFGRRYAGRPADATLSCSCTWRRPINDDLEPYSSNVREIFTQVAGADRAGHSNVGNQIPSFAQMNNKGSDWVVARLKKLCNGHVAGCAYNDW